MEGGLARVSRAQRLERRRFIWTVHYRAARGRPGCPSWAPASGGSRRDTRPPPGDACEDESSEGRKEGHVFRRGSPRPCSPCGSCTPTPDSLMILSSRGGHVPSCGPGRCACGPESRRAGRGDFSDGRGQALPLGCLRSGPWAAGQRSAPRGLAPRVPALGALGSQVRGQLPVALLPGCLHSGSWAAGQRSALRGLAPQVPALRALDNRSEVSSPWPCPSGAYAQGPGQRARGQLPAALPPRCLHSEPWAAGQRSATSCRTG